MAQATFALLTDTELERMVSRAWREAARSWSEYRSADPSIRDMLRQSAEYADAWWRTLNHERACRASRD